MSTPSDALAGSPVIAASAYWRDTDPIVDSATRLAEAVVSSLRSGGSVIVSLRGVRGITSSFANVILQRVVEEFGPEAVKDRLRFQTDSETQERVLARSLQALEQLR